IANALALARGEGLRRTPHPTEGVPHAQKIDKAEAAIDGRASPAAIERRQRAFDPFPGATGVLGADTIKCWRGEVVPGHGGVPGQVLAADDAGITVACGEGALRLTELQRAGGKRLPAAPFLQGRPMAAGMVFAPRAD
ncbi:MAG: methionyl-tRNA formyltransferase, partial [Rhizobacter sp.]|nr:methionyl-tRNA formyltransferase [Rhizobacter sp.]